MLEAPSHQEHEVLQRRGHRSPVGHRSLYRRPPANAETAIEARSQPQKREHGTSEAIGGRSYRSLVDPPRCVLHTMSLVTHSLAMLPLSVCPPNVGAQRPEREQRERRGPL